MRQTHKEKTIKLTKEEIFLVNKKFKKLHRIPIAPKPIYNTFIGRISYKDNFQLQGSYGWQHRGEIQYIKCPYDIGDIVKIWGTDYYIQILDIAVDRIQNYTMEKIIEEGKNIYDRKAVLTDREMALQHDRYKVLWNSMVGESSVDEYGYHLNPWVWELQIRPSKRNVGTFISERRI